MFTRAALTGLFSLALSSNVLAHAGHIGELAGHAHWVGVAAVAGAALIAGLVATKGKKKEEGEETDVEAEGDETAGETA